MNQNAEAMDIPPFPLPSALIFLLLNIHDSAEPHHPPSPPALTHFLQGRSPSQSSSPQTHFVQPFSPPKRSARSLFHPSLSYNPCHHWDVHHMYCPFLLAPVTSTVSVVYNRHQTNFDLPSISNWPCGPHPQFVHATRQTTTILSKYRTNTFKTNADGDFNVEKQVKLNCVYNSTVEEVFVATIGSRASLS